MSLSHEIFLWNRMLYSINCLSWGLVLIMRNTAIQPLLQIRGRRFRDIAAPILLASSYQAVYFDRIMRMADWRKQCHEMTFCILTFFMMMFFLIYQDAIDRTLRTHTELNVSARARTWLDLTTIISQKRSIQKSIEEINRRFAIPLALHHSGMISVTLRVFYQLVENQISILEKGTVIVCQIFQLGLFHSVATRGSTLVLKCLELESFVLMRYSGVNSPDQTAVRRALRFRKEWDVLLIGYFSLNVRNLLRFLTLSITCVAAVLQFDFRVVGALDVLGKSFPG